MSGLRAALPLMAWVLASATVAQAGLADRHGRINTLYEQERYAEMIRETDQQLRQAAGTTFQDSVHLYLYKYGRAHWKTAGAEAGLAAAERIWSLVDERDPDPGHRINALGDLSWLYYELGRLPECVRVDSMALAIALDHAHRLPAVTIGKAHQYLAFDHDAMGDHNRALHHFSAALRTYERADTFLPLHIAESCNGVGVSYWRMGRIRDAERYYMRSLDVLANDTSSEGLARRSSSFGNLGLLWQDAGDLARSRQYYHRQIEICDRILDRAPDPARRDQAVLDRSRGFLNLATVYFAVGDHGRSRQLLELTYRERRTVLEPDDPQVLRLHESFAELEMAAGDPEAAARSLQKYLDGTVARHGRRSGHFVRASTKLASAYAALGRIEQADLLFRESIAMSRELVDGDTDPHLAATYAMRGEMYLERGLWPSAMDDIMRSRAILERVHGAANYRVVAKDILLARALYGAGDTLRALAHADSAVAALQERSEALRTSLVPRRFMLPHLLPDAIYWKVRAERALGRDVGSEERWQSLIDQAISSLQRDKSALTDAESRLLLIGAQQRLFDLGLEIAHERYQRTGAADDLQRFLDLSEADRAILLKSRLNAFSGLRFAGVPDKVEAREQELLRMLDVDPAAEDQAGRMLAADSAYAAFLDTLARDHPRYFALRYGDAPLAIDEVRRWLVTPDRQLLVYARTEENLFALVVRHDTTLLVPLRNEGVAEAVDALREAIAERAMDAYLHAAHDLYRRVFGPVHQWLTGDELLIVPDGPLHTVNFEVLLRKPSTRHDHVDHLLLKEYAIAQLLSVTTAVQFARLDAPRAGSVLAVAPGFTDDVKQHYLATARDTTRIDQDFLRLVRQPFAVRVAQGLGRSFSASVLLGTRASEQRFREEAAHHGVLHLGTHAEMNPVAPMYSRLVLSKDDDSVGTDGYLHAYEIYELDLRAQLAVLTACETGTGRHDNGEGVRSLGHAFAYAGCPSLVMSLWRIDEKASAGIIERFYRHLANGLPKHKALQRAKLEYLATLPRQAGAQDELALPYYWAGMVLVGDVAPVDMGRGRWMWAVLGGVLAMGLLVWWAMRRRRRRVARDRGDGPHR